MSALEEKYKMNLELKGYSILTQEAYIRSIKKYREWYRKSPELLGTNEIREYLHRLVMESHGSTVDVVYSALKFLYVNTLGRNWDPILIPRTKKGKTLPVLLSRSELRDMFQMERNLKHKALLFTLYGAGLRSSEASNLQISDIDSQNMQIRVRQAKGKKDRYTLLSEQNLKILRMYWLLCKPRVWLFPGATPNQPITRRTIHRIFQRAKQKANIHKKVTPHTLRHCFATHLLEAGTSLYHIQQLLGHSNPKTTGIYLHLTRKDLLNVASPLDTMEGLFND
jgi:integrase/recombinase XerD